MPLSIRYENSSNLKKGHGVISFHLFRIRYEKGANNVTKGVIID